MVHGVDVRFFHHLFRSSWFVSEMTARLRGIGGSAQGNVRTPRINIEDFGEITLALPPLDEQRGIADFLDAETARIGALVGKKRSLIERLDERFEAEIFFAVTRGLDSGAETKWVHIPWIRQLPVHWGLPAVGANYDVQLGKMLSPSATEGPTRFPYLRNVNVQWDRIVLDDLLEMHFDENEQRRLELRSGDLLVCEGGEVGRAAVWQGELDACFFQKAIHRVRERRDGNTRFLMYCLRAAAKQGVFAVEGNQSTIVHLTAEQLRIHRFPWPPLAEQQEIVARLDDRKGKHDALVSQLERQVALLRERRQALVTAAVSGQLSIAKAAA
jgi:type I restriction enzyme S subunit